MFYRVKQFLKAITARITPEDICFVNKYLSKKELGLFNRLKSYEQKHCIDVAMRLKEMSEGETEMIRLGLLHDIGKIKYPLSPLEKSLIVILDKVSKGKIKSCKRSKMVKCYYEHPQIGYELLKETDQYEETFLETIRRHHDLEIEGVKLQLLQQADDMC